MKRITIALSVLLLCTGCPSTPDQPTPQQQLQQAQQQLVQQQTSTGNWQLVAGVLAVGCILLFVVGAMLGSKTRRHGKQSDHGE